MMRDHYVSLRELPNQLSKAITVCSTSQTSDISKTSIEGPEGCVFVIYNEEVTQ
jgi:hypothetical protein